jgi:phage terminase large subunit
MEKLKLKEIDATVVFQKNRDSQKKIKANEGGTRSSKTYSIAQLLAIKAAAETEPTVYAICRKTFPALKATAMRDFFTILKGWGWYREANHNKSDHVYKLNNTEIEFFSLDEPEKVRGRKRKELWVNEANELTYEDWRQLLLRTSGGVYLDYNPSDEFSWIYDNVLTRTDCELIRSTYKDNPFLEKTIIEEIERLKDTDDNYWKIYGLGLRGVSMAKIYSKWQMIDEMPEHGEKIYGLDFGFNVPSCLMKIKIYEGAIYVDELIYESHLTTDDLVLRMKDKKISKIKYIYGDNAEPDRIEEIARAGYNIFPAHKNVKLGIDTVKRMPMYITKRSVNTIKEIKSYSWKTSKDGKVMDEPVKYNDHAMDAIRYAVYSYLNDSIPKVS